MPFLSRVWQGLFWASWGMLLLSWLLALAGLASLQNNCYADPSAALATAQAVQGFTSLLSCGQLYRLYWWYIAFILAVLIGLAVTAATGWLVASALSWAVWLAVLGALLTLAGDSFLGLRDVSNITPGIWWSRASTAAAGFILSAIFSLLLSFLLAWRQRRGGGGAGGSSGAAGPMKF